MTDSNMSKNKINSSSPNASPRGKRLKPGTDASGNDTILLALEQQEARMEAMVERVLHTELGGVKASVNALQKDLMEHMTAMKGLGEKVDRVQSETRGLKRDFVTVKTEVERLQEKLAELDDRGRRNNVRLVNLAANREGGDAIRFLQEMLPKWIPSLGTKVVQIERAHRIYSTRTDKKPNRPQTLIFKVLNYQDRKAILQGVKQARVNNTPIMDEDRELLFFADYSKYTSDRRAEFKAVRKDLWMKGISTFLIYPAILRVSYRGKELSFESAQEAEAFNRELPSRATTNRPRRQLAFPSLSGDGMDRNASMEEDAAATDDTSSPRQQLAFPALSGDGTDMNATMEEDTAAVAD